MKTYIKKKAGPKKGPKYRTPDHFSPRRSYGEAGKGSSLRTKPRNVAAMRSKFSGKGGQPAAKFNPSTFKVQHKG